MEAVDFIEDLAIVMLAAGLFGSLCKRIGLSVIVGYLAAGMVVGPFTPPFAFVHDIARIQTLSQLGLVFLMFAIGLELSLKKLRHLGPSMAIATTLGALFVFTATQVLGKFAGWSGVQTTFTAAMLMVSSSAVIAKMLKDLRLEHERAGQQALGIAVLEDIVAIVMITILGSYTKIGEARHSSTVTAVLTGLSGFVVLIVMVALLFVPRLLRRLHARADPELLTIVVAGVLLLLAVASVWAGYSLALGAFLLGAVVAELPQRRQVEHAFEGVRDIFSSVFFVSIGMLIDVRLLAEVWPWILGLGAFVLIVRPLSVGLALVLTGTPSRDARRAGLAVSPLGEFSFIIAQLGVSAGVLPPTHYALAVGVSLVTVLFAPLINRKAGPFLKIVEAREPKQIHRALEIYHRWLDQVAAATDRHELWQQVRGHAIRILVQVLLVTGLLLFGEAIFRLLLKSPMATALDGPNSRLMFWAVLGVIMLLPLAGVISSFEALTKMATASLTRRKRLSLIIIRGLAIMLAALGLWSLAPTGLLSMRNGWLLGIGLAVVGFFFSRRIFALNTRLHGSVESVFVAPAPKPLPSRWTATSKNWALNLQEIVLPDRAACAGRTISGLQIRRRLGCTIVEINRQGYVLAGPEPTVTLFPGDRLLALGTAEQLTLARTDLTRQSSDQDESSFDDARLETFVVPSHPSIAGRPLSALRIPHLTGAVVVGIRKGGQHSTNPSGDDVVSSGDEWLVIGAAAELSALRALLYETPNQENEALGL